MAGRREALVQLPADERSLPLGLKIKAARQAKGLALRDFVAALAGFASRDHISHVESGRHNPSPDLLERIADVLGFADADELRGASRDQVLVWREQAKQTRIDHSEPVISLDEAGVDASMGGQHVSTIIALAQAVEARDGYTGAHIGRVRRHSRRIATALGLKGDDLRHLEMGAILHDVGKIGVPDAVLAKPGPLTEVEWEAICRHPEIGWRLLEQVDGLAPALDAVLYHHERWDGRGYPHGLAGETIPLAARIVAVADAFDAMTSTRPYRPLLPLRVAVRQIWRGRGTQFDERVVAAFLDGLPRGLIEAAAIASGDIEDDAVRPASVLIRSRHAERSA